MILHNSANQFLLVLIVCTINFGLNSANNNICANTNTDLLDDQSASTSTQSTEPCFDLQKFEYHLNKKAQQEKSIEFECYVQNKGGLSVAWLHENQLISLNDKVIIPDSNLVLNSDSISKFNLKIQNVDLNHKGSYRCQIITKTTKNLEYDLDILVPPSITRIPSENVIILNEGESLTVQCLTQGNPRPKLTWSKTGEKPVHTSIDELKSTLTLQNVDKSHADTYSCTAKNGVGNLVTSEFQVLIRFKPIVKISQEINIHRNVILSAVGRKEQIKCIVNSYPPPKMTLFYKNIQIPSSSYIFEESKASTQQFELVYNFMASTETFGDYKCVAENELGSSSAEIKVSPMPSEILVSSDKLPIYSDAVVFEWSLYSGSPIQEINVQLFTGVNNTEVTNLITKTKQIQSDGSESLPTYHNENTLYKDYYDLTKLNANSTYVFRMRVKNDFNEWSEWSQNLTVRTHAEDGEKLLKHKSAQLHHHKQHHDRKHKNYAQQTGSRDLNGKRDRLNSYLYDDNNSAFVLRESLNKLACLVLISAICNLVL